MNAKKREDKIWLMCFQREEYWCVMGSRRGIGKWRRTLSHSTTQHSFNDAGHDPGPSHQRAPPSCDGLRRLLSWLPGAVLRVLLWPCLINAPQAQTVFLEEEDHRHEGRVASSRMRFEKFSGRIKDEGYKENTQTFWKVQFLQKFKFFIKKHPNNEF